MGQPVEISNGGTKAVNGAPAGFEYGVNSAVTVYGPQVGGVTSGTFAPWLKLNIPQH